MVCRLRQVVALVLNGADWLFSPHQALTVITSVSVTVVQRVYVIMFSSHQAEVLTIIMSVCQYH